MSKVISTLFGIAMLIAVLVFFLMLFIHISRVLTCNDKLLKSRELGFLMVWWIAVWTQEGRNKIYEILYDRPKRIKPKKRRKNEKNSI